MHTFSLSPYVVLAAFYANDPSALPAQEVVAQLAQLIKCEVHAITVCGVCVCGLFASLCGLVCMSVCGCLGVFVYVGVPTSVIVCASAYVCICILCYVMCVCMCMCMCLCVYVYVCVYVCMCVSAHFLCYYA